MFKFSGYHTRTDGRSDILSAIGIAIFFRVHNTRTRFLRKKDAPRGLPKGRPHGASNTPMGELDRPHPILIGVHFFRTSKNARK